MRVLFVNENLGGHATVHLNIRAGLRARPDVQASFFDVPPPGVLRRLAAAPIPGLARLDLDLQPLRFQLSQSALVRRALGSMAAGADVLHLYTHNVALLSTGVLRDMPAVVSLDGTNAQNAYRLPYRSPTRFTPHALRPARALERRVYEAATLVVTHSAWAAQSVTSYGIDPGRVRIVPFGVAVPDRLPTANRPTRPRIVFVGRSLARKGGRRLLRLHRERLAEIADLDLVTHDRVEPAANLRVINDIDPGDERLTTILAEATVFVFPSEMDLSPNAVLEAMAAGLPVVALRVGAMAEMVDHGVTGLLVEPDDDRALLTAITSLLADPDRARRMGAAARARALERFDARVTTAALIDVLSDACALHTAARVEATAGHLPKPSPSQRRSWT